ncbi:DUF3858 domain-containing protein [Rufibacter roseus]|uniref:DUF3858 domain-containing protein n=1 Tax=Rufibacter roseus TaxID=1567108 RepID=A0ABW2DK27_9BACT|nr:DUF3858 domain-containing protein [Rufibacter roseus]
MKFKLIKKSVGVALWFLLIIPAISVAQQDPFQLGKVSPEEVKMKVYALDTTATALVLYDYAESSFLFDDNTQGQFKRIIRIKVLKKTGLDEANIEIPFYKQHLNRKEEVLDVQGFTYNLENDQVVKTKLENNGIFEDDLDGNRMLKKITMPNVKVGSVVEVSYVIISDFFHYLREWKFQRAIPTAWSEYRANMVPFFGFKQVFSGQPFPFHIQESKEFVHSAGINKSITRRDYVDVNVTQFRWVMKDVPALTLEPFMTNMYNHVPTLEFDLALIQFPEQKPNYITVSWQDFTKERLTDSRFGRQLINAGYLKKTAQEVISGKTDTLEKVKALWDHVKNTMEWNGKQTMLSENIKKAFENRTGSSSDINLLLVAFLQESGIMASPMLVSTRQHGLPHTKSPMLNKFNYVLAYVKVGGKEYLLDATNKDLPFGMLPYKCRNGQGWVAVSPAGKWVPLIGTEKNLQLVTGKFEILPSGVLHGAIEENYLGMSALNKRAVIRELGEEKYLQQQSLRQAEWETTSYQLSNVQMLQQPLQTKYQAKRIGETQPASVLYISPMFTHGVSENPFKLTARQHPVDFVYPEEKTFTFTYQLPEGYEVESLPQNMSVSLPESAIKFSYVVQMVGKNLQVMSRLQINKAIFNPEEYASLRELYNQLVAKHSEKIVLRKKS